MKGYLINKNLERESLENQINKISKNLMQFEILKTERLNQAASKIARFWRKKKEIAK